MNKIVDRAFSYRRRFAAALYLQDDLISRSDFVRKLHDDSIAEMTDGTTSKIDPKFYEKMDQRQAMRSSMLMIAQQISIANCDAVSTIFHLYKMLIQSLAAEVRKSPFLSDKVSMKALKAARKPFIKHFPDLVDLRNFIQHSGEIAASREQTAKYSYNGTYVGGQQAIGTLVVGYGENALKFSLDRESLGVIDESLRQTVKAIAIYPDVDHADNSHTYEHRVRQRYLDELT